LSGMAAQDNVFRLALPLLRNLRMSGAPGGRAKSLFPFMDCLTRDCIEPVNPAPDE
jgi:hypothetical protein